MRALLLLVCASLMIAAPGAVADGDDPPALPQIDGPEPTGCRPYCLDGLPGPDPSACRPYCDLDL